MDYSKQKFLQNCGEYLIIDKKSTKKKEIDTYGKHTLKAIQKNYMSGRTDLSVDKLATQKNQMNMDLYVMRVM